MMVFCMFFVDFLYSFWVIGVVWRLVEGSRKVYDFDTHTDKKHEKHDKQQLSSAKPPKIVPNFRPVYQLLGPYLAPSLPY